MVYEITKSKHRIFIETLILTLLVLIIGISIGFYIEFNRANQVIQDYRSFEVSALDLKLQNYYYQIMDNTSCQIAIQNNLIFADNIYEKGLLLEKYEQASQLSDSNILLTEKQKYVLLKTELWLNSIILKKKCNSPAHTLVYIYSQNPSKLKQAEQQAVSETLKQIKQEKGNNIILIPIAGDINLDSVSMQLKIYNITYFPSIIIDEKIIIQGFKNKQEIETYLN